MKLTEKQLYKYLAVYFAALDCFIEAHATIEKTVFYRQEVKNAGKRLMTELEKVQRQICNTEHFKDVAYTQDWIEMKKIVRVYLEAIEVTDLENINELLLHTGEYITEKYKQNGSNS